MTKSFPTSKIHQMARHSSLTEFENYLKEELGFNKTERKELIITVDTMYCNCEFPLIHSTYADYCNSCHKTTKP